MQEVIKKVTIPGVILPFSMGMVSWVLMQVLVVT